MEGLGDAAATKLEEARTEKMFTSLGDFEVRSGVNKTLRVKMAEMGLFKDLREDKSQQQNLFDHE
jgi:DNA polymerase III alpha subunit (gram-positive type)